MFCCISGLVPSDPVISRKSGHLFERALIEKSLLEDARCPVSREPLTTDDLLPVQANKAVKPRSVANASIPGMLATFQNEWDEVMVEVFTLKQHLDTTRQELSQALYQHDAACRVIARLMRERDEARAMLSGGGGGGVPAPPAAASSNGGEGMDVDESDPWTATSAKIMNKMMEMSAGRKGRKAPDTLRAKDSLKEIKTDVSTTVHKANPAGVTCLSLKGELALTGGNDKDLIITNCQTGKNVSKIAGAHSKKITSVAFHPAQGNNLLFSGSADKTVKVWSSDNGTKYSEKCSLDMHGSDIVSVDAHPVSNFVVSTSKDGSWALSDADKGECLRHSPSDFTYTSGRLHPDGVLLGCGTADGCVKMWDMREGQQVASLDDHAGGVCSIDISQNGYHLATGDASGEVRIWDLRKLKVLKQLSVGSAAIPSLAFDSSGQYLAIGGTESGNGVKAMAVKEWVELLDLPSAHTKAVTEVQWGTDAKFIASTGIDRTLKIHA